MEKIGEGQKSKVYRIGVGGYLIETTMEFILYFLMGILYTWILIFTIAFYLWITYMLFKFTFWLFDRLGIENPAIVVYNWLMEVFNDNSVSRK